MVAVDPILKRRELALKLGATNALDPTSTDVAVEVRGILGNGADVAVVASASYGALQESLRAVRMCGTVVSLGYFHGQGHELSLGQEWHHNRLTLISSMPVWGNPLRDYPLWDEHRVRQTLHQMFQSKQLSSEEVVDPIVNFNEASNMIIAAYMNPGNSIKLGVRYEG